MITYLLMAAVGAAAMFYGRWQQVRAQRAEADAKQAWHLLEQATVNAVDRQARYESVIAGLKGRLVQLEERIYASDDPAAIRALFGQLFPPAP